MLTWQGRNLLHSWTRNYKQPKTGAGGEEELASAWQEAPSWLLVTKWSALKPYTHDEQKLTQQVLVIRLCIHMDTYMQQ